MVLLACSDGVTARQEALILTVAAGLPLSHPLGSISDRQRVSSPSTASDNPHRHLDYLPDVLHNEI